MTLLSLLVALLSVCASEATSSGTGRTCTFEGFYAAGAATAEPCPGALPCEPGFYCTRGVRFACPAGTYGTEPQLRTKACSGACPAGFYCPEGTTTPLECGGANVYCPLRSSSPQPVPVGFYSTGVSLRRRDRIRACSVGHYCVHGAQHPCPAGTYGASSRLATPQCTAACPAGHYCSVATVTPTPCPGGTYGDVVGATTPACSGTCRAGFYCPSGTISSTQRPCGTDVYCPAGSATPLRTLPGQYVANGNSQVAIAQSTCPRGAFCRRIHANDGNGAAQAELCPGGTYGDVEGLTTPLCAGPCAEGYYCERGSTRATQTECGGPHVYCPRGSATPVPVGPGHYTIGATLSRPHEDQDHADATTRIAQMRCEPGHYCIEGVRFPCPGGTYGDAFGLTTAACSGRCMEGYYCPARSIVATAVPCGSSDSFCPAGSDAPTRASRGCCTLGGREDGSTRSAQRLALPGEFSWSGACFPCPAGTFGATSGETNPRCAGRCLPGYFCPLGSTSATQRECGSATAYCPGGLGAPLDVLQGYYTSMDVHEQCPPGHFRDFTTTTNNFVDMLTGTSPICVNYGDAKFPLAQCVTCPWGTFKPGAGDDASLCSLCPAYTTTSTPDRRSCECFRVSGGAPFNASETKLRFNLETLACDQVPVANAVQWAPLEANNSLFTRSSQSPCEIGHYCRAGVRFPCPAGTYGSMAMETDAECAGACSPGYYCPLASTNSTAQKCGHTNVYCPSGSAYPIPVLSGYYSIRTAPLPSATATVVDAKALIVSSYSIRVAYTALDATINAAVRDAQRQCERGYYCAQGRKRICPAGRYGDKVGEISPQSLFVRTTLKCAGNCKRGYYCPPGSVSPTERECGGADRMCRTGSSVPAVVPQGYYSIGGGASNMTRFHQRPCEPGYFCKDGIKYQCPEGTFGATSELHDPMCSGYCAAGYYCPSHPHPPSVVATQFECGGNSSVYCPVGTGNTPLMVHSGFYTTGAGDGGVEDARNTTRTAQQICPRGFYCRRGIRIRCPEGAYGDAEGLSDDFCQGWCPPGYFCPRGTANYRDNVCPPGTYAPKGSEECTKCPYQMNNTNRTAIFSSFDLVSKELQMAPCTDKRECCFFG